MHGLKPQAQRNVTSLEHRADRDAERLPASIALVHPDARALTLQLANAVETTAMRADRAIWPNARWVRQVFSEKYVPLFAFQYLYPPSGGSNEFSPGLILR